MKMSEVHAGSVDIWWRISETTPQSALGADVLLQYGAIGVIALVALIAVRVLFNRLAAALDRETTRADRLEAEVRELNEAIRTYYAGNLAEAMRQVSDANRAVSDLRRRG